MKSFRIAVGVVVALFAGAVYAAADSAAAFEKLKSLQGSWDGSDTESQPVQVSFRVTSRGSAVMSEIQGKEDMITMFHMDGERLMMTHYCGAGNQPRMVASVSPDGNTMTFKFLDATNVLKSQGGHMQQLVVTVIDANHHTEDWSFLADDGKMQMHQHFDLRRK
jgi:hypothetical protein